MIKWQPSHQLNSGKEDKEGTDNLPKLKKEEEEFF